MGANDDDIELWMNVLFLFSALSWSHRRSGVGRHVIKVGSQAVYICHVLSTRCGWALDNLGRSWLVYIYEISFPTADEIDIDR